MTYFKTTPIKTSRKQMCAVGSHELCELLLLLLHRSLFLKSFRNLEGSKGRTPGDPDIPRTGKPIEKSSEEPHGDGQSPKQEALAEQSAITYYGNTLELW